MSDAERWQIAIDWVDSNSYKIVGYIRKRYLLNYSAYEIADFIAESYIIAYEALGIGKNFEGCFWTFLKNRCKTTLANKQYFFEMKETSHRELPDIMPFLDYLPKGQKEIAEIIAEQSLSTIELASILGISRQAAEQRIDGLINNIKEIQNISLSGENTFSSGNG